MQAIERIRAAMKHLKDVPSSLKTGLGIDEYRAACRPPAMSEVLAHIDALTAENERLTECLKKANAQAEHFEREWYLRGDEVERLRKDAERLDFLDINQRWKMGWTVGRSPVGNISVNAVGQLDGATTSIREAIDAAMKGTP